MKVNDDPKVSLHNVARVRSFPSFQDGGADDQKQQHGRNKRNHPPKSLCMMRIQNVVYTQRAIMTRTQPTQNKNTGLYGTTRQEHKKHKTQIHAHKQHDQADLPGGHEARHVLFEGELYEKEVHA